jgi:hypothetical protein
MCRSIKTLYNISPTATDEEIRAASLQYVRKISGYRTPSKANALAFAAAVETITAASHKLLDALATDTAPRDRATLAAQAAARGARRAARPTNAPTA